VPKAVLTVLSEVSDASILVNGKSVGIGKVVLDVPAGIVTIGVVREGYSPFSDTLKMSQLEEREVDVSLKNVWAGGIKFTSTPSTAKVYIDESSKGTTPLAFSGLTPGIHTVRLEKENCISLTENIKIVKDTVVRRDYRLQYTAAWQDTLKNRNARNRTRARLVWRYSLGTSALAVAGVGAFYTTQAISSANKQDHIARDYANAKTGFDGYVADYNNAGNKVTENNRMSGIFYAVAAVFCAGAGITFFF
jgi:hypothetical protein